MLGIFFVLLSFCNATLSIKICSFNVRTFGEAKRAIPEVVDVIVKVRSLLLDLVNFKLFEDLYLIHLEAYFISAWLNCKIIDAQALQNILYS